MWRRSDMGEISAVGHAQTPSSFFSWFTSPHGRFRVSSQARAEDKVARQAES